MVHQRREELVLLTESAVAVALSVLLASLRLVELPNGGSLALASLPILALAISRGVRVGVLAGCCAGAAHVLAGGTIVHPVQLLLDYFVAYAALGVAGLAARRGTTRWRLAPAILLAMTLHLSAMVVSGMVFFATVAGPAAFTYSLLYNASTTVPEALLAVWLVPPLLRAIARANPADAWRRGLLDPPRRTQRTPRRVAARITAPSPTVSIDTPPPRTDMPRRVSDTRVPTRGSFVRAAPFATSRLSG